MRSKKCIVVLGLHRSGTSALTRILKKCGVYLGDTRRPLDENQKESFENVRVSEFNTKMLAKYNYIWSDLVPTISFDDEDVKNLKDVITKEFAAHDLFAIKEPGIVYLLPLYEKVLSDLGIEINFLLLYRNPLEVAQALVNRNGFSEYKGVFLWLYNFLLGEKFSREYIRGLINFEDLINDTGSVISQIGKILSISVGEQRKLDGLLKSRFKRNVHEDELKKYTDLWLPTIVGQMKHFGDNSQTRLYDSIMQHIAEKIDFISQIQVNHGDFWQTQTHKKTKELQRLRIQWQIKDETLQLKEQDLYNKEQELDIKGRVLDSKEEGITKEAEELYAKDQDLLAKEQVLQAKEEEVNRRDNELQAKDETLQAKDSELLGKDEALQNKNKVVHESEQELLAKFHELKAKNNELQLKDQEVRAKAQKLLALEQELQSKEDILRTKEQEIKSTVQEIQTKEEQLGHKEKQVQAKVNALQSKDAELEIRDLELQEKLHEVEEQASKGFFGRMFKK